MLKAVARVSSVAVFLYVGLAAAIYHYQEKLMFHFAPVPDGHIYAFNTPHEEVRLEGQGGATLHGVLFKTSTPARGVVIYYKGNMGNIAWSEEIAEPFLELGFDVLSMDYRGFGKSRGVLSEAALLSDAEAWYDWAAEQYQGRDVRVFGYSMGTTFASHVSAVRDVRDTILFAPMKSVIDVAERRYPFLPIELLSEYPLRNDQKLARASGHIVIYHGTNDQIIDYQSGKALKAVLGADDSFVTVPGGTHYDLPWREDVRSDIRARWGITFASGSPERSRQPAAAGLSAETAR
ncbi:alpha/beta hydrolase [Kordiimonas lipolytica]|uniref:Alpha/beta hydrolase n=1 Tax=Kordiimonas lipolytica TaxID=1662421 RepID=A0ABV8UAS0_9PROT|nr:alpha/beta fold hydrolase [Kordiimonas lipolytica]